MKNNLRWIVIAVIIIIIIIFIIIKTLAYIAELIPNNCDYCAEPVEIYNHETFVMKSYPINHSSHIICALQYDNFNGEEKWYLCMDDRNIALWDEDVPPTSITAYYYIRVKYCPFCGKEL